MCDAESSFPPRLGISFGGFMNIAARALAVSLSLMLALPILLPAQESGGLSIIPVAGEGAINNIEKRVIVEPIVEIQDQQGRPIEGAKVEFRCPTSGPSATFFGASPTLTVDTDAAGRARANGLSPNVEEGTFSIQITVTHEGHTATAMMTQTNAVAPGSPTAKKSIFGWKLLAVIGAGVAAGVVAGSRRDSSSAATPTSISVGAVSVGAPR
jgi:hypothetical protein